jgi:hypothetical protein
MGVCERAIGPAGGGACATLAASWHLGAKIKEIPHPFGSRHLSPDTFRGAVGNGEQLRCGLAARVPRTVLRTPLLANDQRPMTNDF